LAGAQSRKLDLADAGEVAASPHFSRGDNEQSITRIALLDDYIEGSGGTKVGPARQELQRCLAQAGEDSNFSQAVEHVGNLRGRAATRKR
jgi:hypothetical protein